MFSVVLARNSTGTAGETRPAGDVGQDLPARLDFFVLARRRDRQRHANRIADACDRSGSKAAQVLTIPSGGMPASVTPRCSGTSGRWAAKRRLTSDHLGRIGIFQRNAIARETADRAVRSAPAHCPASASRGSSRRRILLGRIDRAAIDADPEGTVMLAGHVDQEADFVLPRADCARDGKGGPGCNGSYRPAGRPPPPGDSSPVDRPKGWPTCGGEFRPGPRICGVSTAIRTTPAPAAANWFDLGGGRLDVGGLRGAHALHDDRMAAANGDRADFDGPGETAGQREGWRRQGWHMVYRIWRHYTFLAPRKPPRTHCRRPQISNEFSLFPIHSLFFSDASKNPGNLLETGEATQTLPIKVPLPAKKGREVGADLPCRTGEGIGACAGKDFAIRRNGETGWRLLWPSRTVR